MAAHKDSWDEMTISNEPLMEDVASHSGHVHIQDQAGRLGRSPRCKKFFAGGKYVNVITQRVQKGLGGIAESGIIINDANFE